MSLISALLTQDHVVSPKAIDEAIQRQVISGGDFETNLLEIGAIGEDTLAAYCAAIHGIRPMARAQLLDADPAVIAMVPVHLAERYQLFAVRADGGCLVVAVAAPLTHSARVEFEAAVRTPIEQRCVTSARLTWALSRHYKIPLSPRLQRLMAKLETSPPGPIPDDITIPLTRPKPGGRGSSIPVSASTAAFAAFDAALSDDGTEPRIPSTPAPAPREQKPEAGRVIPAAFLASMKTDPSALRTTVPEASPTASTANTVTAASRTSLTDVVNGITRNAATPAVPYFASDRPTKPPPPMTPDASASTRPSARPSVQVDLLPPRFEPLEFPPSDRPTAPSTRPLPQPVSIAPERRLLIPEAVLAPERDSSLPSTTPAPPPSMAVRREGSDVPTATTPAPRGISLEEALQRIDGAADRDGIVDAMLDYAHGRFEYAALFMVQGDQCVGVASRGPGASELALRELSFSLERPSTLRMAHDSLVVEVVSVEEGTSDAEVRAKLQRAVASEVVVVPVRIGAKVALLVWADNGRASPSALSVRQFEGFVQRCAEAFARLITARKRTSMKGGPPRSSIPNMKPSERAPLPDRNARLDALRKALGTAGENPSQGRASSPGPQPSAVAPQSLDESGALLDEAARTNALSDAALASLVGDGERGLAAVFKRFPGAHTLNRAEAPTKLSPVEESGIILRAAVAFRHAALPRLLASLVAADPDVRFCALLCLGEVVHPSAIPALLAKLTDSDYPTRMAAIEVLRNYRRFEEFEAVGRSLRVILRDAKAPGEGRRSAAYALGELRDAESVDALVATLDDPDEALATAAHRALVVIARQDFGTTPAPWFEWWDRAAPQHRIEWLIDALLHAEPTIRHEASEELKRLTGQYFGYYYNLPRRERERAHQRYVDWWGAEGSQRFNTRKTTAPRPG